MEVGKNEFRNQNDKGTAICEDREHCCTLCLDQQLKARVRNNWYISNTQRIHNSNIEIDRPDIVRRSPDTIYTDTKTAMTRCDGDILAKRAQCNNCNRNDTNQNIVVEMNIGDNELEKSKFKRVHKYQENNIVLTTRSQKLNGSHNKAIATVNYQFDKKESAPTSKNKITNLKNSEFSNLSAFLRHLFLGLGADSTDIVLSFNEISVLSAVLEKKTGQQLVVKNIYELSDIFDHKTKIPKRRSEEYYKLVFKQVFKYLQASFALKNQTTMENHNPPSHLITFYQYYFGKTSVETGLSLENYYLPLTVDSKDLNSRNIIAKTINGTYIAAIKKSDIFVNDFVEYLSNQFLADYAHYSNKKLLKVVRKWECLFARSFSSVKAVEDICDFIINNKKSKLPWFYTEVEYAAEVVLGAMDRQIWCGLNKIGL